MIKTGFKRITYLLFLVICLSGCGTVHRMSLPTIGRKTNELPPYSKIKLDGISLYLNALNDKITKKSSMFGVWGEFTATPFEIRFVLIPHKQGFSFEPKKITLKIENREILLKAISGRLAKKDYRPLYLRWLFADDFRTVPSLTIPFYDTVLDDSFIVLEELNTRYGYRLIFDSPPPSPDGSLSLDLSEALKYDSSSVIGVIDFEGYTWVDGSF